MGRPHSLSFSCDQDWNTMTSIACGRFCAQCQKNVIDFTGKRREDVLAYLANNPGTCGRYDAEQVDPRLIPAEQVGRNIRRGVLASLTAIALHTAQAQDGTPATPPSTERIVHEPYVTDAVDGTCPRDARLDAFMEAGSKAWITEEHRKPKRKPKLRMYFTGRFPFIEFKRRKRYLVGAWF